MFSLQKQQGLSEVEMQTADLITKDKGKYLSRNKRVWLLTSCLITFPLPALRGDVYQGLVEILIGHIIYQYANFV